MDVGLIAIAVTFGLLVVSLVTFVSSILRDRRLRRFAGDLQEVEFASPEAGGRFDASLEGLTVEVATDSPSAALLTPLRAGEWVPPSTPAPVDGLADVSLGTRIAGYSPPPSVPEPSFAVESYEPWQVEPSIPGVPVNARAPQSAALPLSLTLPRVDEGPAPPAAPAGAPVRATEEELDREIAALMPTVAFPTVSSDSRAEGAPSPPIVPEPAGPVTAGGPTPGVPPAAAIPAAPAPVVPRVPPAPPLPATVPEASPGIPLEMGVASPQSAAQPVQVAPAPAPVPQAIVRPAPAPAPQQVADAGSSATPGPAAPVHVPEPAPAVETFWEDMLRDQQGVSVPRVEVRAKEPRPEVRVSTAQPAVTAPPAVEPAAPVAPRPARPVARVHGSDGHVRVYDPGLQEVSAGPTGTAAPRRRDVPELVMEAPVEMWFGDSRVGVKAGTATYERFRKYADVLLSDLRESRARLQ